MKKIILYISLTILCSQMLVAQVTAVEAYGQLSVSGTYMVDENDSPVQLQGMSLFWSQWEGSYYREEVVQQMRDDWCTNIIRASMGVDESQGYLFSPGPEKAKVKAVVDAAIDLGMYVIIDWHTHHAEDYVDEATEFFSEMAQTYGEYPNVLYEIYNEPLNVSWTSVIKPFCEEVIDTIRKYDPDNIIICGTPNWCQDVDAASLNPITGEDNIMYTLHYYAGTHGGWHRNKAITAINNGLPLFVTEFGTVEANGDGDVSAASSDTWFDFLDQYKISYCNWSLCDKAEGASILLPNTSYAADFELNLTASGEYMYDRFTSNCPVYNLDGPPIITTQPKDVVEQEGKEVVFSVAAAGQGMTYQWQLNEEDLPGEEANTLTLSNVNASNEGNYRVIITNVHGFVTSETVTLTILEQGPYNGTPAIIPGLIEAEEYDIGARNQSHYDSDLINDGGAFRTDGVDIAPTEDSHTGNYNIGWTATGEWLEYTVDVQETAMYDVEFRMAAATGFGGSLSLEFDEVNVTGVVAFSSTGGWNAYQTVTVNDIALGAGEQKLRMNVTQYGFNLNHMNFIMQEGTNIDNDNDGVPAAKDCDDNDENVGDCTTAINDLITNEVEIYPNPFTDQFVIHAKGAFEVNVYDLTGTKVFSGKYSGQAKIGEAFSSGVYIVDVAGATFHNTVKLVKL